jgi:hypothetical protein
VQWARGRHVGQLADSLGDPTQSSVRDTRDRHLAPATLMLKRYRDKAFEESAARAEELAPQAIIAARRHGLQDLKKTGRPGYDHGRVRTWKFADKIAPTTVSARVFGSAAPNFSLAKGASPRQPPFTSLLLSFQ